MPIRLRLTLAFMVMMAAVLAVAGLFIYARLRGELDQGIDGDLRSRAAALVALFGQDDSDLPDFRAPGVGALSRGSGEFAAVVGRGGRVLVRLPSDRGGVLLTRTQLARGAAGPFVSDGRLAAQHVRIYVQPVDAVGRRAVIVTGVSLAERDGTLRRLALVLLLAGAAALALAALGGYALASAALRPVEAMRRRAARITAAQAGERLPIPPARDEISRLGASLNELLDRLQAALTHERAFVADASHELRTPLGVVKSELELALLDGVSVGELRAAIAAAAAENDHAVALTEDLLTLARTDENELFLDVEALPVDEIFEDVIQRFARRDRHAKTMVCAEQTEGLYVEGDRQKIIRSLSNLVDNALRHGDGPVCLLADQSASHVALHVRDHGEGFPEGFLPRAFDRFARADASRTSHGTGLGLAIVQAIARAHGGSAHATNAISGGADVWISLPTRRHARGGPQPTVPKRGTNGDAPQAGTSTRSFEQC